MADGGANPIKTPAQREDYLQNTIRPRESGTTVDLVPAVDTSADSAPANRTQGQPVPTRRRRRTLSRTIRDNLGTGIIAITSTLIAGLIGWICIALVAQGREISAHQEQIASCASDLGRVESDERAAEDRTAERTRALEARINRLEDALLGQRLGAAKAH